MKIRNTFVKNIFSNSETVTGKSKRGFLFLIAYLCSLGICVFCFAQFVPKQWFWYAWGVSGCTTALLLWRWFMKKEGRSFPSQSIKSSKNTLLLFSAGFGMGSLMLISIILLLVYLLPLELVPVSGNKVLPLFGWYMALIFCAFHEEIGFRSYFLKNLQAAKGIWKSQIIIAIIFSIYHILGGQDVISSLFSTGLWSVVFGLAAVCSRGPALPTGIHAASTVGQAFFGMKLKDGFEGLYILQPTRVMPENVTPVVLATQAFVLTIVIVLFALSIRSNKEKITRDSR